jgi:cbb3-type cytochrome oxidase maturation protein
MFILIGISVLMGVSFLAAFIWAVRSGQFEDVSTPAIRILFDDQKLKGD